MSSVRFKTGSQNEIQAVALNKTGTQCICQYFPPELGGGWGLGQAYSGDYTAKTVTLPSGMRQTTLAQGRHLRCFSEKTEEIMKLCLHMGRELNCLIPLGNSATLISAQVSCIKMRHTLDSPHLYANG